MVRLPTREEIEAQIQAEKDALRPLAGDIGILIYEWNNLHRELYWLYVKLMSGAPKGAANAIWHALKSDSAQRDILGAVIRNSVPDKDPLKADVLWLIGEVGEIAVYRNDLVHAPFVIDGYPGPAPDRQYGSKQTARLILKPDLKAHINEATEHFQTLARWASYFLWNLPSRDPEAKERHSWLARPTRPPSLCKQNQGGKTHQPIEQAAPRPPVSWPERDEPDGGF